MTPTQEIEFSTAWRKLVVRNGIRRTTLDLGAVLAGLAGSFAAPVQTLAALRLLTGTEHIDKMVRLVEDTGALYRFDAGGTGADDGAGTIVPSDIIPPAPGRFFRVSASFIPPYLIGSDPDGAAAVSVIVDSPAYVDPGAKLLSIRNGTVEKAYFSKDGYLSKTCIKGQFDILTTLTPVDASTVTIDYALGNAFVIDATLLTNAHAFTIAVSNVPGAGFSSVITVYVKTGVSLPTITPPAGWTAVVSWGLLSANTNVLVANSIDAGATTRINLVDQY